MAVDDIRSDLLSKLERLAPQHGVDIVDVEIAGSSKAPVVRVRIDKLDKAAPAITLDEVAEQNGWIDALIEEVDPFATSYLLEVSSPGLDRPLRRPGDFERFAGELAQIKLNKKEGRASYTGTLLGFHDDAVSISCDGITYDLPLKDIRNARLKPTF